MKYIYVKSNNIESNTRNGLRKYPVAVTNHFYEKYTLVRKSLKKAIAKSITSDEGEYEAEISSLTAERNKLLAEIQPSIEEAKKQPLLQRTKLHYGDSFGQRSNGDLKFTKAYKRINNLGILLSGTIATLSTGGAAVIAAGLITGAIVATGGLLLPVIGAVALVALSAAAFFGVRTFLKKRKKYRKLELDIKQEKTAKIIRDRLELDIRQEKETKMRGGRQKGQSSKLKTKRKAISKKKKNNPNAQIHPSLKKKKWVDEKILIQKNIKSTLLAIDEERSRESGSLESGSVISKLSGDGSVNSAHKRTSLKKSSDESQENTVINDFANFVRENTDAAFQEKLGDVLNTGTEEEIFCKAMSICAIQNDTILFKKIEGFCQEETKKEICNDALSMEYIQEGNTAGLKMVIMANLTPKIAIEIYGAGIMSAALVKKEKALDEIIKFCPKDIIEKAFNEAFKNLPHLKDAKASEMVQEAYLKYHEEILKSGMMRQEIEGDQTGNLSDEEEFMDHSEEEFMDYSEEEEFMGHSEEDSKIESLEEEYHSLEDFKIEAIEEYDYDLPDGEIELDDSAVVDTLTEQSFLNELKKYTEGGDEEFREFVHVYCTPRSKVRVHALAIVDAAKMETPEVLNRAIKAYPQDKEEEIFTEAVAICHQDNNNEALELIKNECSEDLKAKIFKPDEKQKGKVSAIGTATEMGKPKPTKELGKSVPKEPSKKPKSDNEWGKSVRNKTAFTKFKRVK